MGSETGTPPHRRRLAAVTALGATLVVAGVVAVMAGVGEPADDTDSAYDLQIVLGDDPPLAEVWSTAVNGHGSVAVGGAWDDDRPSARILLTDGRGGWEDLTRQALARSATVGGLAIDRRNNVFAVDEYTSGDFTRRRAGLWSPRAPGEVRMLLEGAWSVDGDPADDTAHVPGRRPTIVGLGPTIAAIDIRDGTDRAAHRLLDATGEVSDRFADGPLEAEPIRPATSGDGTAIFSTGSEIIAMEAGIQRTTTIAGDEHGLGRLGHHPAVSEDGRIVAFIAEDDEGPAIYAARRGDAPTDWTQPVRLDGPTPASVDEPLAATSVRHPPEIGDIGFVTFRAAVGDATTTGDGAERTPGATALWTLTLDDDPERAETLVVSEVRLVVREGDRIGGRTVVSIHAPALAAPDDHTPARDDHWLVVAVDTDAGPLVLRAVPQGSELAEHARDLEGLHHHHN